MLSSRRTVSIISPPPWYGGMASSSSILPRSGDSGTRFDISQRLSLT